MCNKKSSHQLPDVGGRPADLRKSEEALDALQVFARDLVAHDVPALAVVQLLAGAALVDADHGDADGPGGLADGEAEVAVVCVDITAFLCGFDDFDNGREEVVVEVVLFEFAEEL